MEKGQRIVVVFATTLLNKEFRLSLLMVITNIQNRCMRCYEPITNPVCVKCHLEEVRFFLNDFDIDKDTSEKILHDIRSYVREEGLYTDNCVICRKENLSFCSYCFFLIAARMIKRHLGKGYVLDSFLEIFNYQFGHEEYIL